MLFRSDVNKWMIVIFVVLEETFVVGWEIFFS